MKVDALRCSTQMLYELIHGVVGTQVQRRDHGRIRGPSGPYRGKDLILSEAFQAQCGRVLCLRLLAELKKPYEVPLRSCQSSVSQTRLNMPYLARMT